MDIKRNRNQTDRQNFTAKLLENLSRRIPDTKPGIFTVKAKASLLKFTIYCAHGNNGGFHFIPHFYQAYQVKSNTLGTLHNLLPTSPT